MDSKSSELSLCLPGGIFQLRAIEKDPPESDLDIPSAVRPTIYLYDKQAVTLGRSRLTMIRDVQLSRRQVQVMASLDGDYVEATQLNDALPSCINGQPLLWPWKKMVMPGDILSLHQDKHEYILERVPQHGQSTATPVSKKRTASTAFALTTPASQKEVATVDKNDGNVGTSKPKPARMSKTPMSPLELVEQLMAFDSGKKKKRKISENPEQKPEANKKDVKA